MRLLTCAVLLILLSAGRARGQTLSTDHLKIRISGYGQLQFNTTSAEAPGPPSAQTANSTFETRRVRLFATVTIADWIEARVQPEFALGRLKLADAWMNFGIARAFQLRAGQFKLPFSRFFLTSSTQILPIERAVRIRGLEEQIRTTLGSEVGTVFTDFRGDLLLGEEQELLEAFGLAARDMGVSAHGEIGRFSYELGMFNGNGPDQMDTNDAKSIVGRLNLKPLRSRPFDVGVALTRRERALGMQAEDERHATIMMIDVEWGGFRRRGLHALAEAVAGSNLLADSRFSGIHAMVGAFVPLRGQRLEGVEPMLRASFGNPDTERRNDDGLLITPGVNLYFFDRNRLLLNWELYSPGHPGLEDAHAWRAQAQFYF
ncbi:MAG: porin [Gemmatimonadota bacterium]